ncbi:DUF3613 domain-containing protein [Burkholderia gladioli]|uniref:DUF3613 domain-containing protein n=1 Tax=Burkholderia gladioli TaxID=28095 RepID=UPI001FC84CB9|nr:DUF3613 domain-containing protein [Burkholderia gladioli]
MRHFPSHPRANPRRIGFALVVLAGVLGATAARAQAVDPALAQLQQQLQPISGAQLQPQLLAPADAAPAPQAAVQQVQGSSQPLPAVAPSTQVQPARPQPVVLQQQAAPQDVAPPQPAVVAQPVPAPVEVAMQPVPAPPAAMEPARRRSDVGPSTEAWLDLQRSNRAASPEPHPFEGAAASYAYQRYLQSFNSPIPTWFTSVQQGSGGGGSGGSSFGGGSQSQ